MGYGWERFDRQNRKRRAVPGTAGAQRRRDITRRFSREAIGHRSLVKSSVFGALALGNVMLVSSCLPVLVGGVQIKEIQALRHPADDE